MFSTDADSATANEGSLLRATGSTQDDECIAFLAKVSLAEVFPRIKAEAGGTLTLEDLCNPDFVSDQMLLKFELGAVQIRRFRRAVCERAEGASSSPWTLAAIGGAADGGADTVKAEAANATFGPSTRGDEGGGGDGGGEGDDDPPSVAKATRLRFSERRVAREAAKEKNAALGNIKESSADAASATVQHAPLIAEGQNDGKGDSDGTLNPGRSFGTAI